MAVPPGSELVKAGHVPLQPADPISGSYVPGKQAVQAKAPARLKDPGAQRVHEPEPAASLNVPALHAWQGPPSIPVNPGTHTQSRREVAPSGDAECGGHERHTRWPVADASAWYVPSSHGRHCPSSRSLSARENDTRRTLRPPQSRTSAEPPAPPHHAPLARIIPHSAAWRIGSAPLAKL
jgi:hypothetical protein